MVTARSDRRPWDDPLAWNLGRHRAQAALEGTDVVWPVVDFVDCSQVLTDDYGG